MVTYGRFGMGWKNFDQDRVAELRRSIAQLDALIAKRNNAHSEAVDSPESEYWAGKLEERRLFLEELHNLVKEL